MKTYIGTKVIKAEPMTKQEYCDYRGWDVPADEDPNEPVYLIEYPTDPESKPNHSDHKGYISMSPKHVFDKAYKPADTYMDRLLIERDDLSNRYIKLRTALEEKQVPKSTVRILMRQVKAMEAYLEILNERIGQ